MTIPQYPVPCHINLVDSEDSSNNINEGGFHMVSTGGSASTWALSTSTTEPSTVTTGGQKTMVSESVTAAPTTRVTGSVAQQTASASLSPSTPPSPGLSGGAKAGIGVGVMVGILVLIGGIWYLVRTRQRLRRVEDMLRTGSQTQQHFLGTEKVAPPDLATLKREGESLAVELPDPRNSEGWKHFFGNDGQRRHELPS